MDGETVAATVVGVDVTDRPGQPFGTITARVRDTGEPVELVADWEMPAANFRPGAAIRLVRLANSTAGADAVPNAEYLFLDFDRTLPLLVIGIVFVGAVLLVARLKGLAALAGLAGGAATVWLFTLPALATGRNPVAVALVSASAVMFLVVYTSHGVSLKSTAALLSTLISVTVVALGGWLAMSAAHIHPQTTGDMRELSVTFPGMDLRGILLCGMVLAGAGVLNDVTITQAATVWELRSANPALTRRQLAQSAMRIGQDHIASSVYTIAFAYVGATLALLLMSQQLLLTARGILSLGDIAQELLIVAVTSTGMVLAIPLSTALSSALI